MRAFTIAAALLVAGAQAAPALESRQIIYGCYFSGDGVVNQYVSVGHDIDVTGTSGKSYHIDCGTTSGQIVPNVFAKCTVDGKKPDGITANESDKNAINCPIS
ncbi:hypothetical protein CABS01_01793 [Colletotrichum abscissum]|uniref:Uncharacterized protein n=2 Tax=Colletotrichum acutatum species complex TaxID=2707335 RepID=A0A9Q8WIT8_9PEZI|nr:uncharacterized protein CLUP02_10480 [Colletotrichum lupini]XP_060385974.1 uncharacterized protein CTAM01_03737 [Colletotrichum tamarilloi]XP_060398361.1 uncharacterized protein CABS01_01793 [Colletotrichum abscissum]KAI3542431.1 hypothetical protein CSPX01_06909 [Colletotrichum filicis]KAK1495986.1 hypothetical protein CABS01_01793 [Colletotrichum abscissum]KAK1506402.1 hypothetical protein CTAM01_03737 [Colletotrichum tamarilloi]UQC84984.1 hypothetical protein CLUP02_10480 [Colletotrichu